MTDPNNSWREALAEYWDVTGNWQALAGEQDLNFCDDRYVYKVMHAGCDDDLVDMQICCLQHLSNKGLSVPQPVADSSGNYLRKLRINANASPRWCWVITRLSGNVLAETTPVDLALLRDIGRQTARLHSGLADYSHTHLDRTLKWDLRRALVVRDAAVNFASHPRHTQLSVIFTQQTAKALEQLCSLPSQAIHNDLNDFNLLCAHPILAAPTLTGIIDFGDMISAPRVCDIAIAATYLMLQSTRPIDSLLAFVEGYTSVQTLSEQELSLIWPLALSRMAVSAVHAHESMQAGDDDPYLQVSQDAVWRFLDSHGETIEEYIVAGLRSVAGLPSQAKPTKQWMAKHGVNAHALFAADIKNAPILDLSVIGEDASSNPIAPSMQEIEQAVHRLAGSAENVVLGKYREARLVYGAPFYLTGDHQASDRRTMHIAVDIFLPAGAPVHAPLDAIVHSAEVCDQDFDYGGLVVLQHDPAPDIRFFTLYGHLQHDSARALRKGQSIKRGEVFAALGTDKENGGWPPHVHFQVGITDRPGSAWPGVVDPDRLEDWMNVFLDPAPLLGFPAGALSGSEPEITDTAKAREQHSPPSLRLSYQEPLQIVRGWKNLLFDSRGRTYLDAYNNVPHVGHSHPRIQAAMSRQTRLLNTNTRYLQPLHEQYTQALCDRLPDALSVCFLLSSGSEANELALRLARAHTGTTETIALRAGYHGHTVTTIDISDYKFSGPGGMGSPDWVHIVNNPDCYRGEFSGANAGARFADEILNVTQGLASAGKSPGCLIAETFPSVGGQIVPPPDYLQHAYRHVRDAGGVCIADEVQTGLGRLGQHFWGFEQQEVVPDIVVLGKPLGNGYPLAAVITTPAIAASFDTGMEFFATFGGASVACAVGLEVLSIIDDEQLADNAAVTGEHLLAGLRTLSTEYPILADVRGMGLFVGVEIADASKQPLAEETGYIVNRLREQRILIGSDGPDHNVLKIRPPLTFSINDADYLLSALRNILQEAPLAHRR